MKKDLVLERYENAIKDSIVRSFEVDRIIRVSKQDNFNILQEQDETTNLANTQNPPSKGKRLGRIAATGIKGAAVGAAKQKARNELSKEFAKRVTPYVTKAMNAAGFTTKSIPVIGSLVALISLSFGLMQFLKSLSAFTDNLLKHSGVELSGIRSLVGEYSIIDASVEDMEKVAEGLRQNLREEDREALRILYYDTMEEFKDVLVDLLLGLKEVTAATGLALAIVVKLTPGERIVKNILFKAHETLMDIMNNSPEFLQKVFKVMGYIYKAQTLIPSLIPVFGFIISIERIRAFMKIDEIIDTPREALDHLEDVVGYTARKGGALNQDMDDFAQDIVGNISV